LAQEDLGRAALISRLQSFETTLFTKAGNLSEGRFASMMLAHAGE
jgi:hypothetical protein